MNIFLVGGSKGLGYEIKKQAEKLGHNVCAVSRSSDPSIDLRQSGKELKANTRRALREFLGGNPLDALIISSGMGAYYPPLVSEEKIKTLFQVNVFGPMAVYQSCLRELLKSHGKAIFISSVVYRRPGSGGLSLYAATKGSINSWVISEGRRVAKHGMALCSVAPGMFGSPMTDDIHPAVKAATLRNIPFGRWGTSEEIASFVVSLLSQSNWILAGQILEVSGGA